MGEIFSRARAKTPLPWTGERLTQDAGLQVQIEHLHRYAYAREVARGLDVLDVASGEGYGGALLAQTARSVVGVDRDAASVAHAEASYGQAKLRFLAGDARSLPLADASFDLVVSFETLEHLLDHDAVLAEVRRVLRPGGRLLLSTPERDTYSPADAPANPFHVRELARAELGLLLRRHFRHVAILGQRPILGSAIFAEDGSDAAGLLTFEQRGPDHVEASAGLPRAVYLVALASDDALAPLPGSLYVETGRVEEAAQADAARHDADRRAREQDTAAAAAAHSARNAADTERAEALRALAEAEDGLRAAVAALRARDTELRAARGELAEARAFSAHVQAEYDKAAAALAQGAAYVRHVEAELQAQRGRADAAEAALHAMRGSRSWRVTAPLRRAVAAMPALGRLLRSPGAPASGLPSAAPSPTPDAKGALAATLRAELRRFLASGERLHVPDEAEPDVSVLVVLFNQAHLALRCLQALRAQQGVRLEVVLVDNASTDETGRLLERLDGVRILRNAGNRGFVLATNAAAAVARGRSLLLLNSDAFLRPGALAAALATLDEEPRAGAVGGRLVLPSGLLQEAGSIIWSDGSTQGYGRSLDPEAGVAMFRRDVDYCSGAFLLTPRAVWQRLGGFDEAYAPAYYEETDYCMRLREAGLRVLYEPAAVVDHYEFGSQVQQGDATAASLRNRARFRARHAAALARDHLPPGAANLLPARVAATARARRLLMIDDLLPLDVNGAGLPRARAMVAAAVAAGWSVTHLPLHQPPVAWARVRADIPATVEVIDRRGAGALGEVLADYAGLCDAILVSRPHNMALLRDVLAARPDLPGRARLIYDAEALYALREIAQAELDGQPGDPAEAERRIAAEVHACAAGAHAVTCVTEAERSQFRRHLPAATPVHRVAHLPSARVGEAGFASRRGFLLVGRLLEPGSPNWSGLAWFLRACWPLVRERLPDARLAVVGQVHPDHAALLRPGVEVLGAVEDLQPCYDAARVFIAPVRSAAGLPIKVVEAAAAGLPVACTTLMARQMGWAEYDALAAADDPAALAAGAVALHEDAAAWQARRERALDLVRRDFSAAAFRDGLAAALGGDAAEAHRQARVEALWGKPFPSDAAAAWAAYPTSHPVIRAEMNRRATGRPDRDGIEDLRLFLLREGHRPPVARAASLCCGTGGLERRMVQQGIVARCTGHDLAAGAIAVAQAEAAAAGLGTVLAYRRTDLDTTGLGETGLDLVIGCRGVHHIEHLAGLFDNVHAALRPGGLFHLEEEFVGPDRFQWTERQLEEMTAWLRSVPERYRRTTDGLLKEASGRATVADMLAHDPTEAPRSSMIEPLLAERFEILRRHALGGTLTMMALAGIAHNFDPAVAEDVAHLERLLQREAELMASGAIGSDFVTITARRRPDGATR